MISLQINFKKINKILEMKNKIIILKTALLLCAAIVSISCSKSVKSVELDQSTLTLEVGKSQTLTATITPDRAIEKKVTWSSSNPEIATVENGLVTAISEGTATITVTTIDGNKTASCIVTVIIDITTDKQMELVIWAAEYINIEIAGTNTATIDWGDDSPVETFNLSATPTNCEHTYPDRNDFFHLTITGKNVSYLDCHSSHVTSMNLSNNTALKELYCNSNTNLRELDVSKNTALTKLVCNNNYYLNSLYLNKNTALKELFCYSNDLNNLDVSNCKVLEVLECSDNNITNLNLSENTKLKILSFGYNDGLNLSFLVESLHGNTISGGKTIYIGYDDPNSPVWEPAINKGWTVVDYFYYILTF